MSSKIRSEGRIPFLRSRIRPSRSQDSCSDSEESGVSSSSSGSNMSVESSSHAPIFRGGSGNVSSSQDSGRCCGVIFAVGTDEDFLVIFAVGTDEDLGV